MGENEQWKVIPGFDSYEISNTGKIRSHVRKEIIMKPADNGVGYLRVVLHQNDKKRSVYVHRLVASAFVENPDNKPLINHIDNNPLNNNADNLEWCTYKENSEWMVAQGRNKRTTEWLSNLHQSQRKFYKPVIGTNVKTGEKIRFEYLNDVAKLGFQPSCVCNCCKKIRDSHKGYRWDYETV